MGQRVKPGRFGMKLRICGIDAVNLGALENGFGAHFGGTQGGGGISGEERIAGAAGKDHHPALFEVMKGGALGKTLADFRHRDGRQHFRVDAELAQRRGQRQRVDHGGQHAHMVAGHPVSAF